MTIKNNYKQILAVIAALFILFAPVGFTMSGTGQSSSAIPGPITMAQNPWIAFRPSFSVNLAEATTTTTGAGAGTVAAQSPNFYDCINSPATCSVYLVSLVANGAAGLLLVAGAWLVRLGLTFNDNIFNSPAVLTGFSVSLAIANLGFVLGIIIIAIATIIRNQTYGIKQLLWKLVVMAILVNFGLVITAPIVGFANSMSNYFINATSPSVATGGYEAYVTTLMTAFAPQAQNLAIAGAQTSICQNTGAQLIGGPLLLGICAITGQSTTGGDATSDAFWQNVMALLFDVAFSAIAAFTFLALAVLLIIRYLMLGGLLIVLPLAWLTYIFPKFDNNFSKWWDTFIKWTFFPPIALFFIYLAFITAVNTGGTSATATAANTYVAAATGGTSNNASIEKSLATQTGISGQVFAQAADEILLVGLMIMGLMFASSLAGKAGSTAVNAATTVSRAAAGYAGRQARKGATRVYQRAGGENLNAALQRSRIPLVSTLGRGAANLTEGGSKALVEQRSKELHLSGMDDDRLVNVTQGLRAGEDQLAAVQEWQKRGKLDKIKEIGGLSFADWLKKNQQSFTDFTQGKLKGDVDKMLMSDELMRETARTKAEAGSKAQVVDKNGIMGTVGATVSASALAQEAKALAESAENSVKAGINTVVDRNGRRMKADALLSESQATAKEADDAVEEAGNNVDVVDKSGLLGEKGKTVKAGKLMDAASENFWKGKDRGDVQKMRPDWMFSEKPKFGLDDATLKVLQRATTHGVATQTPTHFGSLAGKVDNTKGLTALMDSYKKDIEAAVAGGKMTEENKEKIVKALGKLLDKKFLQFGSGGGGGGGGGGAPPADH